MWHWYEYPMVMDWNPIVSAGVGGTVGLLGSWVTQRTQTYRDRRKRLEERGTDSAFRALELINELHSDLVGWAYEAGERGDDLEGWPDGYLESDGFQKPRSKLAIEALLIPKETVRKPVSLVADRLGYSWAIGPRTGVIGDLVAIELCEYARDVIGSYLRGERQRAMPARVKSYWRSYEEMDHEWTDRREKEEKERLRRNEEERKRIAAGPPFEFPPLPTTPAPALPADASDATPDENKPE